MTVAFLAFKIACCFHLGTLKVCEDTTLSVVFKGTLISTSQLRLNGNVSFACINRQLDANKFSISTSQAVNCQVCCRLLAQYGNLAPLMDITYSIYVIYITPSLTYILLTYVRNIFDLCHEHMPNQEVIVV